MTSPLGAAASALIILYRSLLSPILPGSCRFQPTCSAYALGAVRRFGALRGGAVAVRRLARCHPWGGFGYDPVPDDDNSGEGRRGRPAARALLPQARSGG